MKHLIDTHCWLWFLQSPQKLSARVCKLLENPTNEIYFSAASAWEIAIKTSLGKLKIPGPLDSFIASRLREERFLELPISVTHAVKVHELPLYHQDPFDRILAAQCICEEFSLITADEVFEHYPIKVIWAAR